MLTPETIIDGKYRCERELGGGAHGRVVAATHVVMRKKVALKLLTQKTSASATQRFVREARLAFRLQSPHVAKVYDAGELENGLPYLVMELLDGVDLAKLSHDRGPLPVMEACNYVAQACEGLAEAHALGMVHRDVKLANLFLATTPNGPIVKVLDFGCAKAERIGATSIAHATIGGALLGTPQAMAPEQFVSSRDVDARADVWSLGVALYTLLTGKPPFEGETLTILFERIVKAPLPPISRSLPDGLFGIIERCLRKRREERFADARELAFALAPYAKAPALPGSKVVAIAAVALASMVVGASTFVLASHRASREATARHVTADHATLPVTVTSALVVSETASVPAPTASASASAPLAPVSFFLDVDPVDKNGYKNESPEVQRTNAKIRSDIWCRNARLSGCFAFPESLDCEAEVIELAFACRTAASADACVNSAAGKRYARYRVACKPE